MSLNSPLRRSSVSGTTTPQTPSDNVTRFINAQPYDPTTISGLQWLYHADNVLNGVTGNAVSNLKDLLAGAVLSPSTSGSTATLQAGGLPYLPTLKLVSSPSFTGYKSSTGFPASSSTGWSVMMFLSLNSLTAVNPYGSNCQMLAGSTGSGTGKVMLDTLYLMACTLVNGSGTFLNTGNCRVQLQTNQPIVLFMTYNPTTPCTTLYVNSQGTRVGPNGNIIEFNSASSVYGYPTGQPYVPGGNNTGNTNSTVPFRTDFTDHTLGWDGSTNYPVYSPNANVYAYGCWNRELTAAEVQKATSYYLTLTGSAYDYYTFDGDSLTESTLYASTNTNGQGLSTDTYPYKFLQLLSNPTACQIYNQGMGGSSIETHQGWVPVASNLHRFAANAGHRTVVVQLGTNDRGEAYTLAYTNLKSLVASHVSSGLYDRVVVNTLPACVDQANTLWVYNYNQLIRAGMASGGDLRAIGATHLCDMGAIPQLSDQNWTVIQNPTYYMSDFIHPLPAGRQLMAQQLKTALGVS